MHVLRPLYAVLLLLGIILIARIFIVPKDFGVYERGYTYGWHRGGNEEDWKAVKVQYKGRDYCVACHSVQGQRISTSPHRIIECENCHGPAVNHPLVPAKLNIDRSRDLCLRCHTSLSYPTSMRSEIKGINPDTHNPGIQCVICHNPHQASKPH
jgi:hypothetical protein